MPMRLVVCNLPFLDNNFCISVETISQKGNLAPNYNSQMASSWEYSSESFTLPTMIHSGTVATGYIPSFDSSESTGLLLFLKHTYLFWPQGFAFVHLSAWNNFPFKTACSRLYSYILPSETHPLS